MGIGSSRREFHTATLNVENKVDPDDGNSLLCSACTLPIFFTPFKSHGGGGRLFLHDQCANGLPKELLGHDLHPRQRLILKENEGSSTTRCDKCNRKCGSMLYQCPDDECKFQLDVLCAVQIKVLHRSHEHRLMVIRGSALIICSVCGTIHLGSSDLSYLCNACGFWIHPDCASLPNAINLLRKHEHSLFLTYNLRHGSASAGSSKQAYTCAICGGAVRSLGVYFCAKCRYYAHIRCATSHSWSFKPVLIRGAKLAGLLHFPVADEYTSVMRYIMESTASSSGDGADTTDEHHQSEGKLFRERLHHQHSLIFHDHEDGGDHPGQSSPVCNACVQYVSPPFYSCSQCPDFFLHSCCANLPSETQHPAHKKHTLLLFSKAPKSATSGFFSCSGCGLWCNGFAYSCNTCNFIMDVVCAMMPPSITHELHGKTHILYMAHKSRLGSEACNCCHSALLGICYECTNCRHFVLDARCVLLPNTIGHKFDEHLLKLTTMPRKTLPADDDNDDDTVTSKNVDQICEICERDLDLVWRWYYSCSQCDQRFHCACIPSLNDFSRIKLGAAIRVNCHDCPLTLVPENTVDGYRCGYCLKAFRPHVLYPKPAYECSKCNFRMHEDCAEKCLLKS